MVVNQSARNVRLLIGGADFTPCLISFQGSDNHIDQSGLISFTGSILLGKALDFGESLDDRKNPTRFCRGKSVTLDITDTNGSLTRHPRGTLRILTPKYDQERQQMTLEVGDLIALLTFKEPTNPDKADNKKEDDGQLLNEIIIKLLQEAGITNIQGSIPPRVYNYPLNLSGSYLQSVGKLLYANNLVGWIDNQEIFKIFTCNIRPTSSTVALIIGKSEIWYRRLGGAEAPCEKVKATGTQMIIRESELDFETVTEQFGSPAIIDPEYIADGVIVINKVTTTQTWDEEKHTLTITTTTEKPWGLSVPEIFWEKVVSPPLFSLVVSEVRVEKSFYEKNECKLIQKLTNINSEKAQYLAEIEDVRPDFIVDGFLGIVPTQNIIEDFIYSDKDVLIKKITTTEELAVMVLNGTDEDWDDWLSIPEFFITSEQKTEEWKELDKITWEYNSTTLKSFVRTQQGQSVDFDIDLPADIRARRKWQLNFDATEKRRSNSGQETPPAAERCPLPNRSEENQIEETALFSDDCSSSFKPRERTYNVDLLAGIKLSRSANPPTNSVAHQQLKAIAKREGNLLRGRWQGQEIAGAITNSLLNGYSPLFGVNVTELDNTNQNYLADGVSWVVSADKALWSCDGIWVGQSVSPVFVDANTVIPGVTILPYQEIELSSQGMGMGIQIKGYPYALEPITQQMELGLGLGTDDWTGESFFSSIYWEEVDWDDITETTWNGIKPSPTWDTADWDTIDWDKLL